LIDNNDINNLDCLWMLGRELGRQNNNLSIIHLYIAKQHWMWYHTSRISSDTETGRVQSAALKWERDSKEIEAVKRTQYYW